jgi:hypothetical protein
MQRLDFLYPLDILHFEGGLLKAKLTYAKTERPLV